MTEEQLTALLRLKRYEQPDSEYFERLLEDVHQRQRAELLRRPLWRIALDRMETFFSEHSMGSLSYAGAMATALILGAGLITLATPGKLRVERIGPGAIAATAPTKASSAAPLTFEVKPPVPALPAEPFDSFQPRRQTGQMPRYVIDARPVSYEPSFEF
jgi:hypothetical protein